MGREASKNFSLVVASLLLVALSGCGYHVHQRTMLPFTEVSIGLIDNRTYEPKLQDILHNALVLEFAKQGIGINPRAGHRLEGTINNFEMVGLSVKNGIIVEYRVVVNADFRLVGADGTVDLKRIGSPFIVSLTAAEDLGSLIASKEAAEEKVAADIAAEVVGALIYK